MSDFRYEFPMELIRVIDGDTIVANIDLGFNLRKKTTVRFLNIDTHELHGPNHKKAVEEKEFVEQWFEAHVDEGSLFVIETLKEPDSFGRYLGKIWDWDQHNLLNLSLKLNFDDIEWEE